MTDKDDWDPEDRGKATHKEGEIYSEKNQIKLEESDKTGGIKKKEEKQYLKLWIPFSSAPA